MLKIFKSSLAAALLAIILSSSAVKADQLAWLTKDEVTKAMDFINNNDLKAVILWCACCDNDFLMKIKVSNIYYRQVKDSKEYYEIVIEGIAFVNGKSVSKAVDLAYVHIKKGDKAVCLGLEAGFKCDPCTKPFDWD